MPVVCGAGRPATRGSSSGGLWGLGRACILRRVIWVGFGAVALLVVFGVWRWRGMGSLFSDDHLVEVAGRVAELKQRALEGQEDKRPSVQTAAMEMAYSIAREEGRWVHHLSVST